MTDILLIDDDEKLGELLGTFFDRFDLNLDVAHDPETGLEKLAAKEPDLVILDVMLPGQLRHPLPRVRLGLGIR